MTDTNKTLDAAEHRARAPVVPPPQPRGMTPVLERNIRALRERREREQQEATTQTRIAAAVSRFAGSMAFVYIHIVVFGIWTAVNAGFVTFLPKWDESFVILGTSASVEAIFLSTFVLITQNRMQAAADKRADLDLQISLLAEHEITRLIKLVAGVAQHLGVKTEVDPEIEELALDVAPDPVLDEIESAGPAAR